MLDAWRRACIETLLFWGGWLTASRLGELLEISRQSAQAVISEYRTLEPRALRYDRRTRAHLATKSFAPRSIRTNGSSFLDGLRGATLLERYCDSGPGLFMCSVAEARFVQSGFEHSCCSDALQSNHRPFHGPRRLPSKAWATQLRALAASVHLCPRPLSRTRL